MSTERSPRRRSRRDHVYFDKRTGWWIADYVDALGRRPREMAARTREAAIQVRRRRLDEVDQQKAWLVIRGVSLAVVRDLLEHFPD